MRRGNRRGLLTVACLMAMIFRPPFFARTHSDLQADEATVKFYEQLRQRQLFSLVESDCLRRLSATSLNERERGELILELSRTYAAHAWHTAGSEQDDLWQRATRLIVEHLARAMATPRRIRYVLPTI